MRVLFDWIGKILGGASDHPGDLRAYHARRYAQELTLQRTAKTAEAQQAHRALALAHLELMDAKRPGDAD